MSEGIPCSCGGNNPRCFKCDGRGWIDEIADEPKLKLPPIRKELSTTQGSGYSAGYLAPLPPLTTKKRKAKTEKIAVDKPASAAQLKARKQNVQVKCPDCGQSVFAKNLDKHRANVHQPRVIGKAEAERRLSAETRQQNKRSSICDICGLLIDHRSLENHRFEAHGVPIPSQKPKKKSKSKPTAAAIGRQRTLRAMKDELVEMRKKLKAASPDEVHVGLKLRISELEQVLRNSKQPQKKTWSPFLPGSFESAKR